MNQQMIHIKNAAKAVCTGIGHYALSHFSSITSNTGIRNGAVINILHYYNLRRIIVLNFGVGQEKCSSNGQNDHV